MTEKVRDAVHLAMADFYGKHPEMDDKKMADLAGLHPTTVWRVRRKEVIPKWETVKKILPIIGLTTDQVLSFQRKFYPEETMYLSDEIARECHYDEWCMRLFSSAENMVKIYGLLGAKSGTSFEQVASVIGERNASVLVSKLLEGGAIREVNNRLHGKLLRTENKMTMFSFIELISRIGRDVVLDEEKFTRSMVACYGFSDWGEAKLRELSEKYIREIYSLRADSKSHGDRVFCLGLALTQI